MTDDFPDEDDRFHDDRFRDDRRDDPPADIGEEVLFALPKTRLSVTATEFRRGNEDGTFLTRVPLREVENVRFRRPFEPFCLVFLALGAGLAALGYGLVETEWLRVGLYVAGGLCGLMGLLGARGDAVVFDRQGEAKVFECRETTEDVRAFTESLAEHLRRW